MPFFVIEFRPIRYLLFVLMFGIFRGAAHGDWQAWVILTVCVVLLWGHLLLDALQDLREVVEEVRWFAAGVGQAIPIAPAPPAAPGVPGGRWPVSQPMRQRRAAWALRQ